MPPELLGITLLGLGLVALSCWASMPAPNPAHRGIGTTVDTFILVGGLLLFAGGFLEVTGLVELDKVL